MWSPSVRDPWRTNFRPTCAMRPPLRSFPRTDRSLRDRDRTFADGAGSVEVLEARIAVRMHPAAVAHEMVLRMSALPIRGELIPAGRWCAAAPRPFVAPVGPLARRSGPASAGRQHPDRGVVHCPAGDCEAICREGAKIACPASTYRPPLIHVNMHRRGSRWHPPAARAAPWTWPVRSASVGRSRSRWSRPKIRLWRQSGR